MMFYVAVFAAMYALPFVEKFVHRFVDEFTVDNIFYEGLNQGKANASFIFDKNMLSI
jgi:hypothetical protein